MKKQRITADEYRSLLAKKKSVNKYHAQRTGTHASKKEHGRAGQLRLMESAGLISELKEQVKFELIPTQRDDEGNRIEYSCSYVADFVYRDNRGNIIVEDTKGFRTPEYKIKRKLMLYLHGIRIKEV